MLSDLLTRLRALFRWKAVESEFDDELRIRFSRHLNKYIPYSSPARRPTRNAVRL